MHHWDYRVSTTHCLRLWIMSNEIERIRRRIQQNNYPLLLRSISIDGLRGFKHSDIELPFPVMALAGENGVGKTTILKLAACAYEQDIPNQRSFQPGEFFPSTSWDEVTKVWVNYEYKQGPKGPPLKSLRKPSSRWRGMDKRPSRKVFFLDISRTMPLEALSGYAQIAKKTAREASSTELAEEYRNRLAYIMNREYIGARFATTNDAKSNRQVGILGRDFGEYSQFHQGAGEASLLSLIQTLERIPDCSLLLIDEVEASLHPKAQRRLIEFLLWLSRTKSVQVILSTHSPYVLESLPPEARALVLRGKDGAKIIYGASTEFCMTSIDDEQHFELSIFCEDDIAQAIIRELLARRDPNLLRRCKILKTGPSDVVETLGKLSQESRLPYRSVAFVDADIDARFAEKLPGSKAPERQIFEDLRDADWPDVTDRFGIGYASLTQTLEEAMRHSDHHHWCTFVGDHISKSRGYVVDTLASIWAKNCVSEEVLGDFTQKIVDRLAQ
ncbi:hypothetical protein SacazDRAFT_03144 [Saccharomonospora azurea NA-128]|uniref:AAA+ ATPase domain-containing protein n=2 Tax=Saccharomonospora azurea TaxID=40988 RepID=H8GFG3_9PSEU|nr:hypothetical protein SacazDRAFT_03144 [Saccharomonospora azurea NA-128]